jgi:PPOX class probable F420-dependent enzyme
MGFKITAMGGVGSGHDFMLGDRVEAESLNDLAPEYKALIDGPVTATLATIAPNGLAHLSPIWLRATPDGRFLEVNTARARGKDRHLRDNGIASFQLTNPENAYHWATIYGKVDRVVDEDEPTNGHLATESIDDLADLYLQQRPYPFRKPDEVRTLFYVAPTLVVTFGAP